MKYSLILCTLNRENLLKNCLESLFKQTYQNFEIIIVDQGDNVQQIYLNVPKIKYIHMKQKGLSNARNAAIEITDGDYCCLIDDDAVYPPDWLENIEKCISNLKVDVISGRIKDPETGCYALKGEKNTSIDDLGYYGVLKYCLSACCTIKTSELRKIKFDNCFGVGRHWGAGEETDAIWSIKENGGKVSYNPSIEVYHPVIKDKSLMKLNKIESYNLGFGAMYAKHILKKNIKVFFLYHYALIRNIGGFLLYSIKNDKKNAEIQKVSYFSKKQGYKEYINQHKRNLS